MAYKVVRAELRADHDKIVELLARNEPDMPCVSDQVRWHFERNPHGEGRAFLLLTEPGGKPVGLTGLVMRRMWVGGALLPAGRTWGVSVDKEHRTLGPAIQLARAAVAELEHGLSFIYVLPYTKTAAALFARVGYQKLGRFDRFVRVLRSRSYLRSVTKHHAFQHPLLQRPLVQQTLEGPLAELLAPPADLATRLWFDRPWQRPRDLVACCVPGFDRRFDELWERARARYRVASERSSEFLGWRFRRAWDTHLTVGFTAPGQERLRGYAVVSPCDRQAVVSDLFLEEPEVELAPALFLLSEWVRGQGFESVQVSIAGMPALRAELARRWFVDTGHDDPPPREPGKPPVKDTSDDGVPDDLYVAWTKTAERPVPDVDAWHFTVADDV